MTCLNLVKWHVSPVKKSIGSKNHLWSSPTSRADLHPPGLILTHQGRSSPTRADPHPPGLILTHQGRSSLMGKWTDEELSWLLGFQNLAWTAMFWPPRSLLSKFLFLLMHLFWKATIFQKIPSTVANTHFVLEQGSVLWVGYFKTIGSQARQKKKKDCF